MIRPGPDSIEAGLAPDGLVLRHYLVDRLSHVVELVNETRLQPDDDVATLADDDAGAVLDVAGDRVVVLVIYDGDTGERLPAPYRWVR